MTLKSLTNMSISRIFTALSVLAIVITLGCVGYTLAHSRTVLLDQKRQEIKHAVEAAASILRGYVERVKAGEIALPDAQKAAVQVLSASRFDGNNYYFISTFDSFGIMNPRKDRVGVRTADTLDVNGKNFTKELVGNAMSGGGFTDYYWPRAGEETPALKISYSIGIPEWRWYVAAGLYADDVDATFRALWIEQIKVLAPVALLFCGLVFFLGRKVSRLLTRIAAEMKAVASGDLDVEVEGGSRTDEIGAMARAVQIFKDNAAALAASSRDKAQLETASAAERMQREREKQQDERQLQEVVTALADGLDHLSNGDLVHRIERTFPPQMEKLRDDFNNSVEKLHETMVAISANAQAIFSGSGEISSAADDLSRRTEGQAARLEETAAALDQITETVQKTATGATHASTVVSGAKHDADESGNVVRQAIEAMSGIEKSSQQIGQIIGVIDEIAFQTNLLALNAGVEAARAGDAGRGFAVVASEVRALAQRSAEAAKEIKSLISTSAAQVGQGVGLVAGTGEALRRIVGQIAEIDTSVSEIATGAQTQAGSLREVNSAVSQMDQVTQQNAAMVEQTTAAAHSLSQEADQLSQLVGQFRIAGGAPKARASSVEPMRRAKPAAATHKAMKVTASRGGAALRAKPEAAEDNWEEF